MRSLTLSILGVLARSIFDDVCVQFQPHSSYDQISFGLRVCLWQARVGLCLAEDFSRKELARYSLCLQQCVLVGQYP